MTRLAWFALAGALAACGPSSTAGPDGGGGSGEDCVGDQNRCNFNVFEECVDGAWDPIQTCVVPQLCDMGLGCVTCRPSSGTTCVGDAVHTCNADGTIGGFIEMCPFERCVVGGGCGEEACGAAGTDLIYVVDDTYSLHSFDPEAEQFALVGNLDCPAGASWPNWPGTGPATPFSMSVDRNGRAWVLYTSGEIFWVDIDDASCQESGFVPGQSGFELFGMGFVSDEEGSDLETLYIAGGGAGAVEVGNLGTVSASLQVSTVGPLAQAEYGPELTGTGDAELYGYFPGLASTFVAEIDRDSAQRGQMWPLTGLEGEVRAWAFAHWGGRFYIFVTTLTDPLFGDTRSQVIRLDPADGQNVVLLDTDAGDPVPIIVGAGVSTCAPIEVP